MMGRQRCLMAQVGFLASLTFGTTATLVSRQRLRIPGETLMGHADLPGGPKTGGIKNLGGGMFMPAKPLDIVDDIEPSAPEDTPKLDQIVAPAEEGRREGFDFEDLLMGPKDKTPAQPVRRFRPDDGDSASAPEDKIGDKYHKYFKQVEQKLNGDPCSSITGLGNAREPSCAEGGEIESGTKCTPVCQDGFSPTEIGLYCFGGKMTPEKFECKQGLTVSVEECVFKSKGALEEVDTCLKGGTYIQQKRFLHCIGDMATLKGCINGNDVSKCTNCQARVHVCLDISKQANSDTAVDPEMARLGYNARCGDLNSDERSFAMAIAQSQR